MQPIGFEPGSAPLPVQRVHSDLRRQLEIDGVAGDGLLERKLELVAQIGAAEDLAAAAATPATKDVAENVAEDVVEGVAAAEAAAAPAGD